MKFLSGCMFVLVTGCAADGGSQDIGTGSDSGMGAGGGGERISHVDVRVTDAPGDFDSVFVTIAKVEISTAADGWVTMSDQMQRLDLLTLQNDATALLGSADLAAGSYGQLRLFVASSSVVIGGVEESLEIASGAQTGIKINLATDIAEGMTYTLVLDYDADQSVRATGHGYRMTPMISVKSFTGTPTDPPTDPATDPPM